MTPLRFVLRTALMALPVVVALVLYLYLQRRYIPAARVTANYALNQKIGLIAEHGNAPVDVLAIGSSMTLNNLDAATVVAHFGTEAYLNVGAWGVGIREVAMLTPMLLDRFNPSTVLVSTNLMDFAGPPLLSHRDSAAVAQALYRTQLQQHLRSWNGAYVLRQIESNRQRFTDPSNYEYFLLDRYGSATLNVAPDRIDKARFMKPPTTAAELEPAAYAALEELARSLHARKVRLVLLQCAYHDQVRTPASDSTTAAHVVRLRRIVEPYGHAVADANSRSWPASGYADASHLNAPSTPAFTAYCLEQIAH